MRDSINFNAYVTPIKWMGDEVVVNDSDMDLFEKTSVLEAQSVLKVAESLLEEAEKLEELYSVTHKKIRNSLADIDKEQDQLMNLIGGKW
jgi:hypothetical protein